MTAPPKHRLFFCLYPDPAALDAIGRLRAGLGLVGHQVMHISLNFIFGSDAAPGEALVQSALRAGDDTRFRPFLIRLDHVAGWRGGGGRWNTVLKGDDGVAGVYALHHALGHALGPADQSDFEPHLTLLRNAPRIQDQSVAPITWTARDFTLVHRVRGEGRHRPLGRWDLTHT